MDDAATKSKRGSLSAAWFGGPGREQVWGGVRVEWLLVAGLAALISAWAISNLVVGHTGLVVLSKRGHYGVVMSARLDNLVGALVLFLLAADGCRSRLRWVASGFLVLWLGAYAIGSLGPFFDSASGLDVNAYERLVMLTVAYALFVVGLFPRRPPRFSWRWALAALTAFAALETTVIIFSDSLPSLLSIHSRDITPYLFNSGPLPGLSGWYFALSLLPLGLAAVAASGAARTNSDGAFGGWLAVGMVLIAGAQLHSVFWPLPHGPVLTSMRVLNIAAGATVTVGGILELRRIAAERGRMLAAEQKYSERLRELANLKADFTAMVAHELVSPLAAIRGYTDMLSSGDLPPERRSRTLRRLEAETDTLDTLVADVRAAAVVERGDFTVRARPVALDGLLESAAETIEALYGGHPIEVRAATGKRVWADTERIGQVLRNLLLNAAKHTPDGTSIELIAASTGKPGSERVRIEVVDHGPGIHPEDLDRIFEKFGRGRVPDDGNGYKKAAGTGLGLYLSKRIVQAHGSELTVHSVPGEGSVFAFELEEAAR